MDLVRSLCCIGLWMGHVIVYLIGCIFGRAPHIKETLFDFCKIMGPSKGDTTVWYRGTRHPQVFGRLTICQRTPGFWGITTMYQSLGIQVPRALGA